MAQLIRDEANRGWADARQRALEVSLAELRGRLLEDVGADAVLFAADRAARRGNALLEVVVRAGEDTGEVGHPRPDGVPALLGFVQAVVVGVLGLEDSLLEADVSGNAVALRQQLAGRDEPGETTIAVGHGMNREDVEDQSADEGQGMAGLSLLGGVVPGNDLAEEKLGLLRCGRLEDDPPVTALERDDVVLVGLQVSPATAGVLEEQPVKVQEKRQAETPGLPSAAQREGEAVKARPSLPPLPRRVLDVLDRDEIQRIIAGSGRERAHRRALEYARAAGGPQHVWRLTHGARAAGTAVAVLRRLSERAVTYRDGQRLGLGRS